MTPQATQSCVIALHLKDDLVPGMGKYGRMFTDLPVNTCDMEALRSLGSSGALLDAIDTDQDEVVGDNPCIPGGWPIFGRFIAHNITADRSLLQLHANLGELRNFRSPSLNLESLYGAGPSGNPYLFDRNDTDMFLLGTIADGRELDLPRNQQGIALIGDPRNDVHLPIAQLHVAFLRFHNAIVRDLRAQGIAPEDIFREAQRLTRWHYQWIVVHEYLPLTAGLEIVEDILTHGRRFYDCQDVAFIPVEFSDAAYRFGHSQIRAVYQLNDQTAALIFPDLQGGRTTPPAEVIDWRYFFALDPACPPQPSRRIDARLAHPLITLPRAIVGTVTTAVEASLAYRDLQRGRALDLPSGETVARAISVVPLTADEVGLAQHGWEGETPLWYYVMRESAVRASGVRLSEVGGRIVAEVLLGLLAIDPMAYLAVEPTWRPTLPSSAPHDFTMADLLRFAGIA